MSDGSTKHQEHESRCSTERLIAQRDDARRKSERLWYCLDELVGLKDGPRDEHYRANKDAAWQRAREALRR